MGSWLAATRQLQITTIAMAPCTRAKITKPAASADYRAFNIALANPSPDLTVVCVRKRNLHAKGRLLWAPSCYLRPGRRLIQVPLDMPGGILSQRIAVLALVIAALVTLQAPDDRGLLQQRLQVMSQGRRFR
jgi:hypothetical protein